MPTRRKPPVIRKALLPLLARNAQRLDLPITDAELDRAIAETQACIRIYRELRKTPPQKRRAVLAATVAMYVSEGEGDA